MRLLLPVYTALLSLSISAIALAEDVDLDSLPWETNEEEPFIGDPERALRGGEINLYLTSYPRTFRLFGPNSNEAFASFNRAFATDFGLVGRHPITDKYIPVLATHWAVMPDNKTIYFRLDPDARWSDGQPITADDYTFTYEMLTSDFIVDPFYKDYMERKIEGIDKIDTYTIRIRGKEVTWRPLSEYALFPLPRHATNLNENWVTETNNQPNVVAGPYVISDSERGSSVTFSRVENWWGDKKRYFEGCYNFDRIRIKIIQDDTRVPDFLRRGEIDVMYVNTARVWAEEIGNYDEVAAGYIKPKEVYVEYPEGLYGIGMNLNTALLQNKDFRKAVQYLFHFDLINSRLMFDSYYRERSFFPGTEFESPNPVTYDFNPVKAREHLHAAGFTRRDRSGILIDENGRRASFTLTYGSRGLERHLTVLQNIYKRAGVELRLRLFEPGTAFQRTRDKTTEAFMVSMTSGFFPAPRQYFHSSFAGEAQTNNFFAFSDPEVDRLIDIYELSMDADERIAAMHRLDEILTDEAFVIMFWSSPFIRIAHWSYIDFPEYYFPKRTQQLTDYWVMWFDPEKKAEVDRAMRNRQPLLVDASRIVDYWGIRPENGAEN